MKCARCGEPFVTVKRVAAGRQKYCTARCRAKDTNARWYRNNREYELARGRSVTRRKRAKKAKVRHASDEELLSGVRKISMDD